MMMAGCATAGSGWGVWGRYDRRKEQRQVHLGPGWVRKARLYAICEHVEAYEPLCFRAYCSVPSKGAKRRPPVRSQAPEVHGGGLQRMLGPQRRFVDEQHAVDNEA